MWGASPAPTDSGAEAPLREWALAGDLVVLQNDVLFVLNTVGELRAVRA